jgi:carboxyl-terminal processing protease
MKAGARRLLPMLTVSLLAACGGGEGDSGFTPTSPTAPTTPTTPGISYAPGVYPAAATFANQCQVPRTGTDPSTGQRYPDTQGSSLAEKHFLRSWTNNLYLWFNEVVDRDPASVAAVLDYFNTQKTTVVLPNGRNKDEFHFTYDTAEYYALSQSGTSVGYGISWDLVSSVPPRRLVVQYVQAGTQAHAAGVMRGAEVLRVDGVDLVSDSTQPGLATLNSALFDPVQGTTHSFVFRDRDTGAQRTASLTAGAVTLDPVPLVRVLPTASGNLGYLQFNDHIATAERRLLDGINQLRASNVQDLVLDLRYNGGGFLVIASELAYMIAGPARTAGRTFERTSFNSKHPSRNPVTGDPLTPLRFVDESTGISVPSGQALPTLNLARVFVLTTDATCSASEAIINGLRGVGVEVIQIGGDTCGKPFGFYPEDNCGTTYFSVQFQGVNDLGFGDYAAGFSPVVRAGQPAGATLPGCAAADDYGHDLGDPQERLLKVAMDYRANNRSCALASSSDLSPRVRPTSAAGVVEGPELRLPEEPWRNNRILR